MIILKDTVCERKKHYIKRGRQRRKKNKNIYNFYNIRK